jgi:hypothetical protein
MTAVPQVLRETATTGVPPFGTATTAVLQVRPGTATIGARRSVAVMTVVPPVLRATVTIAVRPSGTVTTAVLRARPGIVTIGVRLSAVGTIAVLRVHLGTATTAVLPSGVATTAVRPAATTGTIAGVPRPPAGRTTTVPGGCWTASRSRRLRRARSWRFPCRRRWAPA